MPQFDLANASLSSSGLTKIKTAEKYIPFVYDDGYPLFSAAGLQYLDNDPKPSSATPNYISDFYGHIYFLLSLMMQMLQIALVGFLKMKLVIK